MDEVARPVELLTLFVESVLLARVLVEWEARNGGRPAPYVVVPPYRDDSARSIRPSDSQAAAMGLTSIVQITPTACLPGCRGKDANGAACAGLREYGEDFCPGCRHRAEYERWEKGLPAPTGQ